jgi:outer membrane protein TolC
MKLRSLWLPILLVVSCCAQRETLHSARNPPLVSDQLPAPKYLQEHVADGKLTLSLHDAIVATLMNNSGVRIQELGVESSKFALLRARAPFDPALQATFGTSRLTVPASSDLQGASIFSQLTQSSQLNYSQAFETGTNVQVGFNTSRFSSNSTFNSFNPSFSSGLRIGRRW